MKTSKRPGGLMVMLLLTVCGSAIPVAGARQVVAGLEPGGGSKPDITSPGAASAWPFRGRPEDLDQQEAFKRQVAIGRVMARKIALTDAATPNYFMYWGVPFAMQLDQARLAVRMGGAGEAGAVARAAQVRGLEVLAVSEPTPRGYVIMTLRQPVGGAAGVNAAIEKLLGAPGVEFAAPVFVSDEVRGGIAYPTDEVLARVVPGAAAGHVSVLGGAVRGLGVARAELGSMAGAAVLRSTARNGFEVMRQANELAKNPAVKWAEPSMIGCAKPALIVPNDPYYDNSWQHTNGSAYDLSSDYAWTYYGFGNAAVRVLILDSGIDPSHEDLNQTTGRDFTSNLPNGTSGGGPDYRCDNHGTEVAGMVSLLANNSVGGIGTCPVCPSVSGKVGYDDQSGTCDSSWSWAADSTIAAIAWGVNTMNCQSTNASFSAWPHSPGVEDQYADASVNDGAMNFASTGNDSSEGIAWPSSAPYVWAVGALGSGGARASFSNWGDGIDFTAPGQDVLTSDRMGSSGSGSGNYVSVDGTSFSSPAAAGVAAYLKSIFPFATRSQVYGMMRDGVSDTGTSGYDIYYGHGRLNTYASAALNTPSNDTCGGATYILGAASYHQTASSTWATSITNEPQAPCEASSQGESSSVFYLYQALDTGLLSLDTLGSSYDTVLSVFTGCGSTNSSGSIFTSPSNLACNDDVSVSVLQSQISNLWLDDGQSVLIKVSKYGTSAGGGTLDFTLGFVPGPPLNDTCGNAIEVPLLASGNGFYPPTYSVERATRSTCEGTEGCGSGNGHSVWYEFTPPVDGVVSIDTSSSNYDTVIHLYQQNGTFTCPTSFNGICTLGPSLIGCDDDSGASNRARLTNIGVSTGQVYKLKISGRGTAWGRVNMDFTFAPLAAPVNDACSSATVLDPAIGLHVVPDQVTNRATASVCDGVSSCGDPAGDSNTVWYRITPTEDCLFTGSTQGSNYNTVLTVYSGGCRTSTGFPPTCIGRQSEIACNDNVSSSDLDSLVQQVVMNAGGTYYVKIADRDTADEGGNLKFNYLIEPVPPPPACDPDYNQDGNVDQDDVRYLVGVIAGGPNPTGRDPDFNGDGNADQDDYAALVNVIAGASCP